MKTAILIGATGLTGSALLDELILNEDYTTIKVITRSAVKQKHPKIEQIMVDFDEIEQYGEAFKGDVLFSTLGTTLKTAGSKERQYEIDYEMQFKSAKLSAENGVDDLMLLSAAGANANSSVFYSKMKGELDEAVKELGFEQVAIIRPSMLVGNRDEWRWSEKLFTPIIYAFSWIPGIRKYRPIHVKTVAQAMIQAEKAQQNYAIYSLNTLFKMAKNYRNSR